MSKRLPDSTSPTKSVLGSEVSTRLMKQQKMEINDIDQLKHEKMKMDDMTRRRMAWAEERAERKSAQGHRPSDL